MRSALLLALMLSATPVLAAESARYVMTPIEGGVIRLDTQTGAVSTCKPGGADLVCRGAIDDRTGLEEEIARLNRENEGLKQRLAAAGRPLLQLPDDTSADRAFDLFERFARRFKGIVDDWRNEDEKPRNRT